TSVKATRVGRETQGRRLPTGVRRGGERHPWPHKPGVCGPGQAKGSWGAWLTTADTGGTADVQQVRQSAVAECNILPRRGNLFPCFYAVSVLVPVLLIGSGHGGKRLACWRGNGEATPLSSSCSGI